MRIVLATAFMISVGVASVSARAAPAEAVRFVCTNNVGAPEHIEVDLARKAAASFDEEKGFHAEYTVPATISAHTIAWTESFSHTNYTIDRQSLVMENRFEGTLVYKKNCKRLSPGANWR